ncbi:MAG TPA: hypothetical protein VLT82_23590 [Myxococcaceae bacterium]|nr:hypothetical protein [Myxococcaceae bacterium]
MVEVRALPARERVMIVLRGQVLAEELEEAERKLRQALPGLGPAFDVIADISGAEPLGPEAMAGARRLAELLAPAGLRIHVRVVGRSAQTALQFQRISRAVGYDSRLAFSLAEAEGLLDASG